MYMKQKIKTNFLKNKLRGKTVLDSKVNEEEYIHLLWSCPYVSSDPFFGFALEGFNTVFLS